MNGNVCLKNVLSAKILKAKLKMGNDLMANILNGDDKRMLYLHPNGNSK